MLRQKRQHRFHRRRVRWSRRIGVEAGHTVRCSRFSVTVREFFLHAEREQRTCVNSLDDHLALHDEPVAGEGADVGVFALGGGGGEAEDFAVA